MELQLEGLEKTKYESKLRDMYAGQAMQAILTTVRKGTIGYDLPGLAIEAYLVANYMMEERAKK